MHRRSQANAIEYAIIPPTSTTMSVLLETTFGDLVIDLDVDGSPALSKNILKLAKARYYTNTLIYNVVPGKYCQMGGEHMMCHNISCQIVLQYVHPRPQHPIFVYNSNESLHRPKRRWIRRHLNTRTSRLNEIINGRDKESTSLPSEPRSILETE